MPTVDTQVAPQPPSNPGQTQAGKGPGNPGQTQTAIPAAPKAKGELMIRRDVGWLTELGPMVLPKLLSQIKVGAGSGQPQAVFMYDTGVQDPPNEALAPDSDINTNQVKIDKPPKNRIGWFTLVPPPPSTDEHHYDYSYHGNTGNGGSGGSGSGTPTGAGGAPGGGSPAPSNNPPESNPAGNNGNGTDGTQPAGQDGPRIEMKVDANGNYYLAYYDPSTGGWNPVSGVLDNP